MKVHVAKSRSTRLRPRTRLRFATVLGISDGILNALILASATVLHAGGLNVQLAARVGVVAAVSAAFTVFVAEYAQCRSELAQAERQLMYTRSGRLAATNLGRATRGEAMAAAGVAASSSFIGACAPLAVGAILPHATYMALVVSVGALGVLGSILSSSVGGRRVVWVLGLMFAGVLVTAVGVRVDLV